MNFLRDSFMGKEFVKYRRTRDRIDRLQFSQEVASRNGKEKYYPVVVDTVDEDLTPVFQFVDKSTGRFKTTHSGLELVMSSTAQITDILKHVKMKIIQSDREDLLNKKITLGLENGDIIDPSSTIREIYSKHAYKEDNILYILASTEQTMYGYIMSIIKFLSTQLSFLKSNLKK